MWLAFRPWISLDWLMRYQVVKYPQGYVESDRLPIRWRYYDVDWLEKVAPGVAARMEQPHEFGRKSEESAVDQLLREGWAKAIDGLLPSQIEMYRSARTVSENDNQAEEEGKPEPWYFKYLDDIAKWGEPEFWAGRDKKTSEERDEQQTD